MHGDRHQDADARSVRAGDHAVEVGGEVLGVEVAVVIDEHGGILAPPREDGERGFRHVFFGFFGFGCDLASGAASASGST